MGPSNMGLNGIDISPVINWVQNSPLPEYPELGLSDNFAVKVSFTALY